MTSPETSSPEFFEAKYVGQPDPWNFSTDAYESGRYEAIVAAVSHRRYRAILEPGCSIGILTQRLAALGDHVEAFDFSASAAEQARCRCLHLPVVNVTCSSLAEKMAPGFDLIVLSEIGYYSTAAEWKTVSDELVGMLEPGAVLLASHWLGSSRDHQMTGDQVHEILGQHPQLNLEESRRHPEYRLDRWVRT